MWYLRAGIKNFCRMAPHHRWFYVWNLLPEPVVSQYENRPQPLRLYVFRPLRKGFGLKRSVHLSPGGLPWWKLVAYLSFASVLEKCTIFDFLWYQVFAIVELHFHVDSVFTTYSENLFFQRIRDTSAFFEILHELPGFIDKKVKPLPTVAAAHIQEKTAWYGLGWSLPQ